MKVHVSYLVNYDRYGPRTKDIEEKEIMDYLGPFDWEAMTCKELANILKCNPRPWHADSFDYGPFHVDMPNMYCLGLHSCSKSSEGFTFVFKGSNLNHSTLWEPFHNEMGEPLSEEELREWCETLDEGTVMDCMTDDFPNLFDAPNVPSYDWLDAFLDQKHATLPLSEDEHYERMSRLEDLCAFLVNRDTVARYNRETDQFARRFHGLPSTGRLRQLLRNKFSDLWDAVRHNRCYAMWIMTHPLKRAKKLLKRDADGEHVTESLPPLPVLPKSLRRKIDAYLFV